MSRSRVFRSAPAGRALLLSLLALLAVPPAAFGDAGPEGEVAPFDEAGPGREADADDEAPPTDDVAAADATRYERAEVVALRPVAGGADEELGPTHRVRLEILSGKHAGRTVEIDHRQGDGTSYDLRLAPGDAVVLAISPGEDGPAFFVTDHDRRLGLLAVAALFTAAVVAVAGRRGLAFLACLAATVALVFGGMVPLLLRGHPPVGLAVGVSFLAALVTMAGVCGLTRKAAAGLVGTLAGVAAAAALSATFSALLNLTGFVGHETAFLQEVAGKVDAKGLMLAGVIVGALGGVLDVSISIASAVEEVSRADRRLRFGGLFRAGMNVGRDMIGATANTMILAYTGGSLTVIVLLVAQGGSYPLVRTLNFEFISIEILRALVGGIGMALAAPATAAAAAGLSASAGASLSEEPPRR